MTEYTKSLDPSFLTPFKTASPPWGPVGFVTYVRTYARKMDQDCECPNPGCKATCHRIERYWETVKRCVEGVAEYGAFTKSELETLYSFWFNLKCSGAGRHWWQLGTPAVNRIGADSLQNCWFVACKELRAFEFAFNELMLGGGVGFSVMKEHIYKLPPVKFNPGVGRSDHDDVDFIVPDNREGWVHLLHKVLRSFFITGRRLIYSVKQVRAKGKRIRTFGGTASGGEILVEGVEKICKILRGAYGRQLTSVECLDIFNIIGHVVVAGNVRRSAELAIGDADDHQFIDAKNWQIGPVPTWRQRSNNSIACAKIHTLPDEFWDNYNGEGEPVGLINLNTMRAYGRLADGLKYRPDPRVEGTNACGETSLEHAEACNLFELYLPNLNPAEFYVAAELGVKVCKTISCIPHAEPETKEVVERNHRLGIGVTGYMQALDMHDEKLFDNVYHHMEEVDRRYSELMRVTPSIKLTCVKPSGTLSLLPGVTPGMHPAFGDFYLRRIEFAADDVLVEKAKAAGYWVEPKINLDGSRDLRSMVVEFPCKTPRGTVLQDELTAVQQLEHQLWLQTHWADNSVSCTINYFPHELPAIREWLARNYDERVKTVSFLLRGDASGFKQMPYEAITEEEYEETAARVQPIADDVDTEGTISDQECIGGHCPAR